MPDLPEPAGYPQLASLFSAHPETAILRRFGRLNALNLLYLQAELTNLENALCEAAKSDAKSEQFEVSARNRDWQALQESVTTTEAQKNDGRPTQWSLMLQVRDKLNEYNQALYLQHKIAKIGPPNKQDFKFLQTWMKVPSMGNVYLLGADSDVWETKLDSAELVCLLPRKSDSPFTRFLTTKLVRWYHHSVGHLLSGRASETPAPHQPSEIYGNTVQYSHDGFTRLGEVISTIVTSLLLVGSIVVLYSMADMKLRLVTIGIFTASFSLGLCLFTNGRMIEVFSASAAFAAVQVVFVGTTSAGFTP